MMDIGRIYGRGISFPPRLGPEGRLAWSMGPESIREAIRIVLLTEPGERLELPEFGSRLRMLLHEPNTVATRSLIRATIEQALGRWEPRIELGDVLVEPDPEDTRAAVATIAYRLVVDQSADRLSLRLPLGTPA